MVLMQPLSSIPKASNEFLQLTIVIWLLSKKRKKEIGKKKKKRKRKRRSVSHSKKTTHRKTKKGRKKKKKENFDLYTIWKKDTHTQSGSLVLFLSDVF